MTNLGLEVAREADARGVAESVIAPGNDTRDADILSIPGAGKRMLREFKEYRPYANIEQFRKEIGKYVDKKEVARLEKYVTLN